MTAGSAVTAALAAILGVSAPARHDAPPKLHPAPSSLSGAHAHQAGLDAYERGEFEAAAAYFERAFAITEAPGDLYGWAQAARSAGDCAAAIELYRLFIDLGIGGQAEGAAQQNIERCEAQIAAAPPPSPTPAPIITFEPPDDPAIDDDPSPPATDTSKRQRPDPAGLGLTIVGGAAALGGGAMLGIGEARRADQRNAGGYQRFDSLDRDIDRMHVTGAVTLAAGVTLAVIGVALLVVHQRRGERANARARARRSRRWATRFVPTNGAVGW